MADAEGLPILEFDPSPNALIEAARLIRPIEGLTHCVFCFFQDVITRLIRPILVSRAAVQHELR